MTYPPQQPGPYGPPDPYGQQPRPYGGGQPYRQQPAPPDPYGQPTGYQGIGGYGGPPGPPPPPLPPPPPPPPERSNTRRIIAVIVIAVLVLGGAGAGVYFMINKDDPATPTAGSGDQEQAPQPLPEGPVEDDNPEPADEGGSSDPAGVQQAYIEAYQNKRFRSVVNGACEAYKIKFGTDTTQLEQRLAPWDVKATADGEPAVTGTTATAKIDLELTKGSETQTPKIQIKIVKESGRWKFCGEGEA